MKDRSKLTARYLQATKNEIAIDSEIYRLCGVSPKTLGYLPRPSKILRFVKKRELLFGIAVAAGRFFWLVGGFLIYFVGQFIVSMTKLRHFGRVVLPSYNAWALITSDRSYESISSAEVTSDKVLWVKLPGIDVKVQEEFGASIDIPCLLTFSDYKKALFLSVMATCTMVRSSKLRPWALQSYTAYKWFCVYLALGKLKAAKILMSNHFDRWAVLVDSMVGCSCGRVVDDSRLHTSLTLIQHGEVKALDRGDNAHQLPFTLHRKLNAINSLVVYDDESADIFKRSVISRRCVEKGLDVSFYTKRILLQPVGDSNIFNILFVGHPACEQFQIALYLKLRSFNGIKAYYKPHPSAGMGDFALKQDWYIIQDKKIFPDVDLLISYPSTLIREYAHHGISAVVHPLSAKDEDLNPILSRVKSQLKS